jgi:hypothetical protein
MAKTLKQRTKRFNFNPLPYHLIVVVTNDIPASISKYGLPDPRDPKMKACVFNGEHSSLSVMFLPSDADVNTVAHESVHVIWNMFEYAEIKYDSELLAYYLGYLTEEIGEFVWYGEKQKKPAKACQAKISIPQDQALTKVVVSK